MQASGIPPASCNSSRQEPQLPLPFLGTWPGCLRYPAPGNRSFFPEESEGRMDYFLPSEIGGCTLALVGGSWLWRKNWSPALHQNLCLRSSSELNTSCSSPHVPLYFPAFFPLEILEWGWNWKSFSYAFLSSSALESWKCLFLFPKLCEYLRCDQFDLFKSRNMVKICCFQGEARKVKVV